MESLSTTTLSPSPNKYFAMMQYNNAKLCNVLFAFELARRWQTLGISVFSLHPGNMVSSNLSRNWWVYRLVFALVRPFTKSLVSNLASKKLLVHSLSYSADPVCSDRSIACSNTFVKLFCNSFLIVRDFAYSIPDIG